MKIISLIFILLFVISCDKNTPILTISENFRNIIEKAEEQRFSHPEFVDSVLQQILPDIKRIDNDNLWAKYYYLQAHVALYKNDFVNVTYLLDSTENFGLNNDINYKGKVMLLKAVNCEELYLNNEAFEYYNELYNNSYLLNSNERLIAIFGKARVEKKSGIPFNSCISEVDQIIKTSSDIDYGLYNANMAYLSDSEKKAINFYKEALLYYQNKQIIYRCISTTINIASLYINYNNDSSLVYLENANATLMSYYLKPTNQSYQRFRDRLFLDKTYAKLYYTTKNYSQSLEYIDKAIPIADSLKLNSYLHFLKKMKSNIFFKQKKYLKARQLLKESYKHHYKYRLDISDSQIKYINAKNNVDRIISENKLLKTKRRIVRLRNQINLLYSIICSIILLLIIFEWQKLKYVFSQSKEQSHKKDIKIQQLDDRLLNIKKHMLTPCKSDAHALSKIGKEIKSGETVFNWDTFFLMYSYKYPLYEQRFAEYFPELNLKDIQFIMAEHWVLSDEKIAQLFNIKIDSVRKKRQRLKNKLKIPAKQNIREYIITILTNTSYKNQSN